MPPCNAPFVPLGGHAGGSPADVAEQCDTVVTMLPASPQVKQVFTGENGILGYGARTRIHDHVNTSTFTHTHTHTHTHTEFYSRTHTKHTRSHTHAHTHIHMITFTHAHTHNTHAHTHTHSTNTHTAQTHTLFSLCTLSINVLCVGVSGPIIDMRDIVIDRKVHAASVLIDSSTIDPSVSQEMEKLCMLKGATYLDAPVSGGESTGVFVGVCFTRDASCVAVSGTNQQATAFCFLNAEKQRRDEFKQNMSRIASVHKFHDFQVDAV